MIKYNRFKRGSGLYTCQTCNRLTRSTGDGAQNRFCEPCWDIAGWENTKLDNAVGTEEHTQAVEQIRLLVLELATKFNTVHPDYPEIAAEVASKTSTQDNSRNAARSITMAKTIKNSNVAVAGKQTPTVTPAVKKVATPQVAAIKGTAPLGIATKKQTAKVAAMESGHPSVAAQKRIEKAVGKAEPKTATKVEEKHPTPKELASTAAAAPTPKAKKEKKMGDKDAYGFGENSQSSFLINGIASGKYTRAELLDAFVKQFCSGGKDEGGDKRKKISFSVFFSDIKKPFATYHACRSLIVVEDAKTKKLSLEPKRADAVREAIGKGLLQQLRGLNKVNHPTKIAKILKEYGLPTAK